MTAEQRFTDRDIIERYTDQPARLPAELRSSITALSADAEQIVSYALADLDQQLAFRQTWIVLTTSRLLLAREQPDGSFELLRWPRDGLTKVELALGLSCHVVRVYGKATDGVDAQPLAEWRFTHRQRRSMEGLAFLLEQVTKRIPLEAREPDLAYLESVAQPIREAQALVSTRRLAVVWRLLSYLKPYQTRVI